MLGYEDVLRTKKTIAGKVERTPVIRALGLERFWRSGDIPEVGEPAAHGVF